MMAALSPVPMIPASQTPHDQDRLIVKLGTEPSHGRKNLSRQLGQRIPERVWVGEWC
jgi:hypothetical protein